MATTEWRLKLRELPRPVKVVLVAMLVNRTGTMALPFLVLYLTNERELPAATSGLVLGVYGIGSLIAGPLSGWLLPKLGARPLMLGSLLGSGACLLALSRFEDASPAGVLLLVLAWAVSSEAFRPVCSTVVASHVAPADRRGAFAALRLAANLGMTIGPALGGMLVGRSFNALFAIDAATSFGAAALLIVGPPVVSAPTAVGVTISEPRISVGQRLAVHLLGVGLIALVTYQALSTMALYMTQNLQLGEAAYGFVFSLSGLLIVVCEAALTARLKHWSHRRALVWGALLTSVGFAALGGSASLEAVVAVTLIWTTGEMLLGPAAAARVADLEPSNKPGLFMGLYSATWSAAFAFGPWLGMQSFTRLGPKAHWLCVGVVGLAAAALFATQRDTLSESAQ